MSSYEDPNFSDADSVYLEYYCYNCHQTSLIDNDSVLNCPYCTSDFLQLVNFPSNPGDYVAGSNFDDLLDELSTNDGNLYGTPPASESAVSSLTSFQVSESMSTLNVLKLQCMVCLYEYNRKDVVTLMPCQHVYSEDCILQWLKLHNSCPICRYELPTDDADYEQRKGARLSLSEETSVSSAITNSVTVSEDTVASTTNSMNVSENIVGSNSATSADNAIDTVIRNSEAAAENAEASASTNH